MLSTGSLSKSVECSLMVQETLSLIPGRLIPKTLKMAFDTYLLNTQQYKVRVKGKVEQPREIVAPSPTPRFCSYWKGGFLVVLNYGHQLYFVFKKLSLFTNWLRVWLIDSYCISTRKGWPPFRQVLQYAEFIACGELRNPRKWCPLYDNKLQLMVRHQSWISGEWGELLHWYYSLIC